MRKLLWVTVAVAALGIASAGAQEPRKGGTIRMTAPYAASFGSLDPEVTAACAGRHRQQGDPSHAL